MVSIYYHIPKDLFLAIECQIHLVGPSSVCIMSLPQIQSRSLLDSLLLTTVSFQQMLKFLWEPASSDPEISLNVSNQFYPPYHTDQVISNILSPQCHLHWPLWDPTRLSSNFNTVFITMSPSVIANSMFTEWNQLNPCWASSLHSLAWWAQTLSVNVSLKIKCFLKF